MRKQKKQTGITIGQKIRRFFLKLIATVVVVGILVAGIAGTLMYLGIVDISGISSILKRTGSEDENLKKFLKMAIMFQLRMLNMLIMIQKRIRCILIISLLYTLLPI